MDFNGRTYTVEVRGAPHPVSRLGKLWAGCWHLFGLRTPAERRFLAEVERVTRLAKDSVAQRHFSSYCEALDEQVIDEPPAVESGDTEAPFEESEVERIVAALQRQEESEAPAEDDESFAEGDDDAEDTPER